MAKIWEGKPSASDGMRFAVVMSRFNSTVTDGLLEGALEALKRAQVAPDDVEVARVPGAFEIPLTAKRLAESRRFSAVICLGAVVKGGTPHWDYLSRTVTDAIERVALDTGVPMANALLTTETLEQAVERARGRGSDNKGYDAALAAVEMAVLFRRLSTEWESNAEGRS
jgi:6,7-dimethyl-8-ribityllumazine synthase